MGRDNEMTQTAGAGRSPRFRRGRFVAIATGAALVIVAAQSTVVQAAGPVQYLDDGTIVHRPMYVEPPVQEWK